MRKIIQRNWALFLLGCAALVVVLFGFPETQTPSHDDGKNVPTGIIEKVADAAYAARAAVAMKTHTFQPDDESDVPVRGRLRVEVIDANTLCLVGSYMDFLRARFVEECGTFLKGVDSHYADLKPWQRNVFYNVLGARMILKYRPKIAKAYQNTDGFSLECGNERVNISQSGYWINPLGIARFPEAYTGALRITANAEVAHYAYLKLAAPLRAGAAYRLKNPLGETVEFAYEGDRHVSGAVKYNQLGTAANAARKYAYVGAWLGSLKALDLSRLEGRAFFVKDAASDKTVFAGTLKKRGEEAYYLGSSPFTGEHVYEADFSALTAEGVYYVCVPTVGSSETFRIGNDALGEAFYTHARGLYHKRCGTPKCEPYTAWKLGACHLKTYRGHFPSNILHYTPPRGVDKPEAGFFDEKGTPLKLSAFKVIEANATSERVPISGGWHDAGDYDRRPCHYDVVNDLLTAYLFKPENFADGQLNIPESGNGIPDILDEAIWGMEIWRHAQAADGGVGGWIETVSHPTEYNPAIDTQPYYLSDTTMESTMQYAAHASMLALALRRAGKAETAQTYLDSAVAAYRYAENPANRLERTYQYPFDEKIAGKKTVVRRTVFYREEARVPAHIAFKAAYNLYLLTRDYTYLKDCQRLGPDMPRRFGEISWCINPLFFAEFALYRNETPELASTFEVYRRRILQFADERMRWLDNSFPYRIPWRPPESPAVTQMGYGRFHPFNNAKFFVLAYAITGDRAYRDAAYLANDWHNGANPTGQTMTSGLGKNYPVKFLDLPSYADGIDEYVPGITPYRNNFGIARADVMWAHALIYEAHPERDFVPNPVMLLPPSVLGTSISSTEDYVAKLRSAWPIWRRFPNVESYSVGASEYTVSETIAPAAAITGWLLEPGWTPSDALKQRRPAKVIESLKGYAPLP